MVFMPQFVSWILPANSNDNIFCELAGGMCINFQGAKKSNLCVVKLKQEMTQHKNLHLQQGSTKAFKIEVGPNKSWQYKLTFSFHNCLSIEQKRS